MSLQGAVSTDRPGRVVRAGRSVPPRARRRPAGRVLAVLLAVALGAGGAIALLGVAVPGALASVTGQPTVEGPGTPSELVLPAVVVSASSCVAAGAQDLVDLEIDGARHRVPLDGCGSIVGTSTTVRVLAAADPAGRLVPRGEARVLGTGGSAPLDAEADGAGERSPMASRITVTLTVVAGVAMAGLLVALGREGARTRTAATPPAPRPATGSLAPSRHPSAAPSAPTAPPAPARPASGTAPSPRERSRARSLRAPHPARAVRGDGRRGPGAERGGRGTTARPRTRRPR